MLTINKAFSGPIFADNIPLKMLPGVPNNTIRLYINAVLGIWNIVVSPIPPKSAIIADKKESVAVVDPSNKIIME